MKIVKIIVVSGIIATMSVYAQDGSRQGHKKEESKTKAAPAQEMTVKTKSSNVKTKTSAPSGKVVKYATKVQKHEDKKANSPK